MRKTTAILILSILFTGIASAQTANETKTAIKDAQQEVKLLEEEGIPTERVDNLLETANNSYLAQKNFAEEGGTADYSRAIELTEQISDIQQRAIRASDRIDALKMRIKELEETSVNLTSAKQSLDAAETDFESQRFEEADTHVEEGYSSISEAQSARTQLESFAAAQQEALTGRINTGIDYVKTNTLKVASTALISIIMFTFLLKEFNTYRLIKRKKRKRIKEEVLEDLITDIQREYYMKKEGSSVQFETKLDRFEEMRRDVVEDIEVIDRKIEQRRSLLWDTSLDEEFEPEMDETAEEEVKQEVEEEKTEQQRETEKQEEQMEQETQVETEESDTEDNQKENEADEDKESASHDEVEVYDPSEDKSDEEESSEEDNELICEECGESFGTERGLHIHQTQQHGGDDEDSSSKEESSDDERVECPVCGDVFDTKRGMHIHRGEVHDN